MSDTSGENYKFKMIMAYMLWFLLGGLGMHRFYLGRIYSAMAMASLPFLALMFMAWPIGVIFLTWWLSDAYFVYKMIKEPEWIEQEDHAGQDGESDEESQTRVEDVEIEPVDQR